MNKYSRINLKNVKTLVAARDGYPWSATVYWDNKKVGTVMDYAMGGDLDINIPSAIASEMREYVSAEGTDSEYGDPLDIVFAEIADEYETEKQLKKWCRNKIVIRLKKHGEGEFITISKKYNSATHNQLLVQKYGDSLEEIVNERFV